MKDKIFALLTKQFAGVRKDALMQLARSLALQFADENDAKEFVEKLTDAQINDYTKEFRAEVDKEVSESTKKFESNLKKKFDFVEKSNVEPGNKLKDDEKKTADADDIATIVANAIAKAVEPLQVRLNAYEGKSVAESRLRMLNEKLENCKDDTFKAQALKDYQHMQFESDEAFNEYLTDKAKDIESVNQRVADDALRSGGGNPLFSQKNEEGVSQAVQQYLAAKKPEDNKLAGKQL